MAEEQPHLLSSKADDAMKKKKEQDSAQIDTSPPFESVKEAVTRFGGSGFWIPLHLLRDPHLALEEFDIEKVEEQASELERRLKAKEQETHDALRDVEMTKRMIEGLKLKRPSEACNSLITPSLHSPTPDIMDMREKNLKFIGSIPGEMKRLSLCSSQSSADLILAELKQAKFNLSRTTNDLSVIRASVETLNKKVEKQKSGAEMPQENHLRSTRLTKATSWSSQHADIVDTRKDNQNANVISRELEQLNFEAEQFIKMAEAAKFELLGAMSGTENTKLSMRTAEMRWVAAKKMEEAAKAVEAVALAEMECFERTDLNPTMLLLQRPEKASPPSFHSGDSSLILDARKSNQSYNREAIIPIDEANISKFAMMKKLEEATQEVQQSKRVLEEAFERVEVANKQILKTGEALRRWGPEKLQTKEPIHHSPATTKYTIPNSSRCSFYYDEINAGDVETKHVIRPTRSVGELLSRRQMIPEEYDRFWPADGHHHDGPKVSLSQMLNRQRTVSSSPSRMEGTSNIKQRHAFTKNRKFGFIHLSIPLIRHSKSQASTPRCSAK